MREREVERYLVQQIKKLGGLALKLICPGFIGIPDRLCLLPGGHGFFVECKAPTKEPTKQQLRVHALLKRLGFVVIVVDSKFSIDHFIKHDLDGPAQWNRYKR